MKTKTLVDRAGMLELFAGALFLCIIFAMGEKAKEVSWTVFALIISCALALCLVAVCFYKSIGPAASSWLWVFWSSCAASGIFLLPFFLRMPGAMSKKQAVLRQKASHVLDDIISRGISSSFFKSFPEKESQRIYEEYKAGTLLGGVDGRSWSSSLISAGAALLSVLGFADKMDVRMTSQMWLETVGSGIGFVVLLLVAAVIAGSVHRRRRSDEMGRFIQEAVDFNEKEKRRILVVKKRKRDATHIRRGN